MLLLSLPLLSFFPVFVTAQASSYAPMLVACPSIPLITRSGSPLLGSQVLDPSEASFQSNRRANISPALWRTYLNDQVMGTTGYNLSQIVSSSNVPRLASAVSGGGLRASLYGAGTLSALDSRNTSSVGGLLQLSDYLSGLSGGSWVVTSLMMSGLSDIYSLVLGLNDQPGWLLHLDILAPGGILALSDNNEYYDDLIQDVQIKAAAGFPVSIIDVWGRALSYHFFNQTTEANFYENGPHDQGLQWSSIKLLPNFASLPFPIVVTTSRVNASTQTTNNSDTTVIPLSNTQFEFTPYTYGSFDPTLSAHIPVEYAGTFLSNGIPVNSSACVSNYQNAGFVIGSSAALFNAVENVIDPTIVQLITLLTNDINDIQSPNFSVPLVANYPNSFYNFVPSNTTTFESAGQPTLEVTDGGENGENIPIAPLLVKSRAVDVILAIDSSADTSLTWPNGTSLIATSIRIASFPTNFSSFPPVPQTPDIYVSQGLNVRPTFFGCNTSGNGDTSLIGNYPLVIYLPNAPPPNSTVRTYFTNTSTLKLDYSMSDSESFLDAAHANALMGYPSVSGEADPDWPLCLKCAVVDRARKRANVTRSPACKTCMDRYCWSGDTTVETTTSASSGGGASSDGGATGAAATLNVRSIQVLAGVIVVLACALTLR